MKKNAGPKIAPKIIDELILATETYKTALLLATHDTRIANRMDIVYELSNSKLKKVKTIL